MRVRRNCHVLLKNLHFQMAYTFYSPSLKGHFTLLQHSMISNENTLTALCINSFTTKINGPDSTIIAMQLTRTKKLFSVFITLLSQMLLSVEITVHNLNLNITKTVKNPYLNFILSL